MSPDLSPRLAPLFDGRPGLRCAMPVQVREPAADPSIQQSGNPPILDFVSSDPTLDRYHEIISPAGWQLATYQKNPVFQNAHQYGDIIFTLGRALITEVRQPDPSNPQSAIRNPHLFQRIQFAVDANPMAKIAYALYAGKFLNAVSVGFVPLRWQDGTPESNFGRKYLEQELLEVSAVAIPANPNALALAYKSGALEKSDLKETATIINHLVATDDGELSSIQHPASAIHSPSSSLRLLRQLRDILRS